MTVVFESFDLDVMHDTLSRLYGKMRLTVIGDQHLTRISRDVVGSAELHRVAFTMRCDALTQARESLFIGRVVSGTISYRTTARNSDHTPGSIFIAPPEERTYRVITDAADCQFAMIKPAMIDEIASTAPNRKAQPVRFTGYEPTSAHAAAAWNDAFDYACRAAPAAATEPVLAQNIARLLTAAALTAFPNTALYDPTIEDRHDAHPAALRRALAFIDENAHRDISPADIAKAAHVSIRAVQLAFRRHLDTTPLAYLRRVRLEQAHKDLLAADPSVNTVAAIAAHWGFDNHSRFTAQYRAAYGQVPSRTLRQ